MTAARKPLVYVAGPITGDPWGCVRRATHAAAILGDLGCHAYLPQLAALGIAEDRGQTHTQNQEKP